MYQRYRSRRNPDHTRGSDHTRPFSLSSTSYARRLSMEVLEDRRMLAVLTVQNSLDDTLANLAGDGQLSLREAIEIANNPGTVIDGSSSNDFADEIGFDADLSGQSILLAAGELKVSEALTIDATALIENVTIDAQQQSRIFSIDGPNVLSQDFVGVALAGLNLTGGSSSSDGGAIRFNTRGTLTLDQSIVHGNSTNGSYGDGGGIHTSSGAVILTNSTVSDNSTTVRGADGGGIYSGSGELTITNSTISGNSSAGRGGGIFARFGAMTLTDSAVNDNSAVGFIGGGIFSLEGDVTLINSTISGNSANRGGGILSSDGNVTLTNSTISGNSGGGISASSGALTLTDTTVSGNSGGDGGGIFASFSTVMLVGSTVLDNTSSNHGGGIHTSSSSMVTLIDSTVSGNTSSSNGGGIFSPSGLVMLVGSVVSDNYSDISGGGIHTTSGIVTVTNSAIVGNTTTFGSGGGIYTTSGSVELTDSTVSGNATDSNGGGIRTSSGAVTLIRSTVSGNSGTLIGHSGGGIRTSSGAVTLNDSTVSDNSTGGSGGGISSSEGEVSLTNSTVSDNISDYSGGGISADSGAVTLANSTVSGNISDRDGGGIVAWSGSMTLIASTITGNTSDDDGGGLRTGTGSMTLIASTITGNTSGDDGGGLRTGTGVLTLTDSTVSGNVASVGGGISAHAGQVTLVSSTVSGNSSVAGGGIFAWSGSVTLDSSTVTDNGAEQGRGGGIFVYDAGMADPLLLISNSIVAGNAASSATDLMLNHGSTLVVNHSLIGVADDLEISGGIGNQTGTLLNPFDPLLGPLTDNGGLTQTHALLSGSPAIDAGKSAITTDQRGLTRPVDFFSLPNGDSNGSDIGAFELQTLTNAFLPSDVVVAFETLSDIDLSSAQFVGEDGGVLTVTLTASKGTYLPPTNGTSVTATLTDPQTVVFVGTALAINTYLDNPSNKIHYIGTTDNFGDNAAMIDYTVNNGMAIVDSGRINIDIFEPPSLIVTTIADIVDGFDGITSLREAVTLANAQTGADMITFDAGLSGQTILLAQGELQVMDALTIDATALAENVIIDAQQESRILNIDDLSVTGEHFDVALAGLTLTGGVSSSRGGAVQFVSSGELTLEQSTISGNASRKNGGGISTGSGTVILVDSTVDGNRAYGSSADGGGIHTGSGAVRLINSTVSGNSSWDSGGGIYTSSGSVTLTGSTVSGNVSRDDGGGIFTIAGIITLNNSTVTGNVTEQGLGGGIFMRNSTSNPDFQSNNSIIALNTASSAPDLLPDPDSMININYSLIGDTSESGIVAITGVGNLLNVDSLLGPLADNGGPTQTHALLPGSPALNSGDPLIPFLATENDQRGVGYSRVAFDRIDIGAYEAHVTSSADFDTDGDVNGTDFLAWQRGFGIDNAVRTDGNSDDDTDVDASDLAAWQVSYGLGSAPVGIGQAALGSEVVVDAAFAALFDDDETSADENGFVRPQVAEVVGEPGALASSAEPIGEPVFAAVESRDDLAPTSESDDELAENQWLADGLLERVFG